MTYSATSSEVLETYVKSQVKDPNTKVSVNEHDYGYHNQVKLSKRYKQQTYNVGFSISKELLKDERYKIIDHNIKRAEEQMSAELFHRKFIDKYQGDQYQYTPIYRDWSNDAYEQIHRTRQFAELCEVVQQVEKRIQYMDGGHHTVHIKT